MSMTADFHSHVLPGIDDGSRSPAQSLQMLRMEGEQGIGAVVATPHFYPQYDTPEHFLVRRARAEGQLREAMKGLEGLPQLHIGAEVYYFHGISQSEAVSKLTIDDSPYLLIEMPSSPWTETMYRELADLAEKRGIIPIIAHVDRYLGWFRTYGIPEKLAELPVLVQANAEFFLERPAIALRMLKREQIHLLGSDCHNLTDRKPNLAEAIKRIQTKLGPDALKNIEELEAEILGNTK